MGSATPIFWLCFINDGYTKNWCYKTWKTHKTHIERHHPSSPRAGTFLASASSTTRRTSSSAALKLKADILVTSWTKFCQDGLTGALKRPSVAEENDEVHPIFGWKHGETYNMSRGWKSCNSWIRWWKQINGLRCTRPSLGTQNVHKSSVSMWKRNVELAQSGKTCGYIN